MKFVGTSLHGKILCVNYLRYIDFAACNGVREDQVSPIREGQ